jgi:hypothetical protein
MEPGRDAADSDLGCADGQGGDEGVAASPVAGPVAPQVPVDLAAAEQVSEGQLVQRRRGQVVQGLLLATSSVSQAGSTSQPSRSAGARVLLVLPA